MSGKDKPDSRLVEIVDAELQTAARKSGAWLVCRPGCSQCCMGVFAINQLDAVRLREGMAELARRDPARAANVRERVGRSVAMLTAEFPGDPITGVLGETGDEVKRFGSFADDEPCPVLDPVTGTCDLYASRPMTCRIFGPPVRSDQGLAVCELCYHGATAEEIAACEMTPDPSDLEFKLLEELERKTGARGETIVAFALAD